MRFYKYLNEALSPMYKTPPEDYSEFISEWRKLNNLKQIVLWHGTHNKGISSVRLTEVPTKTDRKSKDTSKAAHDFMNIFFKKKFGVALRSETVFSSTATNVAANYGIPYGIIPSNGYVMYQHPFIKDFYSNIFSNGWMAEDDWDELRIHPQSLIKRVGLTFNKDAYDNTYMFQPEAMFWSDMFAKQKLSRDIDFYNYWKTLGPYYDALNKLIIELLDKTKKVKLNQIVDRNEVMIHCKKFLLFYTEMDRDEW